jgi:phytoene dehydrogenase-like protein
MSGKDSILSPPAPTTPAGLRARKAEDQRRGVDHLKGIKPAYDVIVIGSGLAGLTSANVLAKAGHSVLLLEQHYNFGGLATWFKRKHGHVFDISLHGFPQGMVKTCRKYWTQEIADSIVQLREIRFDNPEFSLSTTFDRADFTRILVEKFGIERATVEAFFDFTRGMNFYDDQSLTTRGLFERFFPGRKDVWRLLMEPIAYANGSTLDDPAITYGIVFSNFMSKGVFTFQGGTDQLIKKMKLELQKNGVELRNHAQVEQILAERGPEGPRATGVLVNGREVRAKAVISNANLVTTVEKLLEPGVCRPEFVREAKQVRMNSSSSQVYLGLRRGESIPNIGELFFTSTHPEFDSDALVALECTSRTFSFYYPDVRPGSEMFSVVASINSRWEDWANLTEAQYLLEKEKMARESIEVLEGYLPGIGDKLDHVEVATPRTFEFFTQHKAGTSFGTKFEGLAVSKNMPKEVTGLFHAGSVGIIMSGWLGAANYGVIVSNDVDRHLRSAQ